MIEYMVGRSSSVLFRSFSLLLVIFGFSNITFTANGQSLSESTPAHERTLLAQTFVAEKLWSWQKRLGLEDWNIAVVVSRASELKPRTLGNIHWELDKKTAIIHVLDPADYKLPFKEVLQDLEFTVVHELIHLDIAPVLTDVQRSDANRREEEHAVNHVADALLKLERK
jgi:hypothetical protein